MQFKVQHQKLVKMQRATWAVDKATAGALMWPNFTDCCENAVFCENGARGDKKKIVVKQWATWAIDKQTAGAPSRRKSPNAAKIRRLFQNSPIGQEFADHSQDRYERGTTDGIGRCALWRVPRKCFVPLGGIRSLMALRLKMQIAPA